MAQQKYILSKLNAAEAFETFLQTKYVGQKRFSLEGAESTIPLMDAAIDQCAEHGLDEVVIGMPHRGRLNVLANIVGKPYSQIFSEFEGNLNPAQAHGSGDVKYHLGATGMYIQMFGDNDIQVSLTANPSHLEAVDPVLEGLVRAKQDLLDKGEGERGNSVVPMMLHGDAAFAGQGVVAETLNLAKLPGYRVGGTIHIIVNNQIGFTTAPEYSRSSEYCTDVAKMIGAPIFHVNGDDPEACVWVARLAVDFRQKFKKDVIIDMLCYRRRGHNEGDDPSMTNPYMYDVVDIKRGVRKSYTEALIGRGDISLKEAEDALARLPGPARAGVQRGPRTGEARRAAERVGRGRPDARRRAWTPRWTRRCWPASATRSWRCPRDSPRTRGSSRCWRSAARWPTRARSTGPSANCWRSVRWWPRASWCGCRVRTPAAAPSPSGIR